LKVWTLSARILLSIAAYVLSYILFVCSSIYWDLVFLFKTQSRVFIIINIVAFIIIGLCYNKFEKAVGVICMLFAAPSVLVHSKMLKSEPAESVYTRYFPLHLTALLFLKRFGCKKVMDLGCGTGRHTIYLAQNGYQVFAVDISETGIEVTRAKAEKLNLTNIEFAQLDMRNLSVDDNLMDAIMCVWTSGHGTFEDARKNLKEMYRILRLGEILVIDYVSREDENYGKGTEIEKNTFINNVEGEENIPHHYFAKEEIEELYTDFSDVDINPVDYYFTDSYGTRHTIKAFVVIAVK